MGTVKVISAATLAAILILTALALQAAEPFIEFYHGSPLLEKDGYGHTMVGVGVAQTVGSFELSAAVHKPIFSQDPHAIQSTDWDEVIGTLQARFYFLRK